MIHLQTIGFKRKPEDLPAGFPFLPIFKAMGTLEFTSEVTFLVGENGSGKSTFLEALACCVQLPTVGSVHVKMDRTLDPVRQLSDTLKLVWKEKVHRGFFMRAEDFFGFAKRVDEDREELERDLRDAEEKFKDRSRTAYDHARMPFLSELSSIENHYGDGLDGHSHGESFLELFRNRFAPKGLYILDEPEVPLSPLRQLTLISMLKEMVEMDSQFIIATHSPILMAFPGAVILSFDGDRIKQVPYEELEHVTLTRAFLNNPEAYLRHL